VTLGEDSFSDILRQILPEFGLTLDEGQAALFVRHFDFLIAANKSLNLTAITDPVEAAVKHYCDSLAVLRVFDGLPPKGEAVDVGSGAGFPGIPLAIALPDWSWTLIEAKRKKADFLKEAAAIPALRNVEVVSGRSETLAGKAPMRDHFDFAVGRAIAPIGAVAETLLPLVRPGGIAVAMKGPADSEVSSSANEALRRLGAEAPQILEYDLPRGMGKRALVVIPKSIPTPEGFPRRPGMAAKRPLF
jgi:16S rRNA (guanine527-N7)-methyltransferase